MNTFRRSGAPSRTRDSRSATDRYFWRRNDYAENSHGKRPRGDRSLLAGGEGERTYFTSGQIALDPATGAVVQGGIAEQTKRICENLKAVLAAAGSSLDKAVKTTCFLADMNDFAAFNEVYGQYFTEKPARSCVAVKTLPKNVLAEVEVIATE